MKDERLIVRTMERLGIATAYGNRTQAIDYLNRTLPASCGFVAYNPFMPARVGWENYTIYIGGEDDMQKARILEGELTKWFNVRYEQYPRYSGNHVMMNVSVRAMAHHIGMFGGGLPSYLLKESDLGDDEIALVVSTSNGLRFVRTADAGDADFTTYPLKPYVRFHRGKNGRVVVFHASQVSSKMWAEYNRYRIHCDTTAAGGFSWAVTINGSAKSGSVTWAAGDTLDSIVSQMTGVATYLAFSHESGEEFIRVRTGGYTNSTFTLSDSTGATLDDLSFYTRIDGVQQSEAHRTWQAQNVDAMFPSLGFLASNTVQYSVSGYNLSYRCGGNETRYKEYYDASGSSSYLAENAVSSRMTSAAFAALNGSGVEAQQALYDKYNGSWDAYMEASMVALDDTHTGGIEYQSYDNGDTQTAMIATITTMDFDGSYIPAFPAAYYCYDIEDSEVYGGHCHLSTNHEIGVFMRDANYTAINSALDKLSDAGISVTKLSVTSYYWSVARYNSYLAWFYYGNYGTLYSYYYCLYTTWIMARPLAYLNA